MLDERCSCRWTRSNRVDDVMDRLGANRADAAGPTDDNAFCTAVNRATEEGGVLSVVFPRATTMDRGEKRAATAARVVQTTIDDRTMYPIQ